MKVFIDAGCNEGGAISQFKKKMGEAYHEWVVHAFDVLPIIKKPYHNVTIHKQGVWIRKEKRNFYINPRKKKSKGNSLMENKQSGKLDKKHPLEVECIDFSKWISDNFKKSDEIVLDMDIEGSEYAVLDKMIKDGTIDYINNARIEFHYNVMNMDMQVHTDLLGELKMILGDRLYAYNARREEL